MVCDRAAERRFEKSPKSEKTEVGVLWIQANRVEDVGSRLQKQLKNPPRYHLR